MNAEAFVYICPISSVNHEEQSGGFEISKVINTVALLAVLAAQVAIVNLHQYKPTRNVISSCLVEATELGPRTVRLGQPGHMSLQFLRPSPKFSNQSPSPITSPAFPMCLFCFSAKVLKPTLLRYMYVPGSLWLEGHRQHKDKRLS